MKYTKATDFPKLLRWLRKIGATFIWSIAASETEPLGASVEAWMVPQSARAILITIRAGGWNLFIDSAGDGSHEELLADAEKRLGIAS